MVMAMVIGWQNSLYGSRAFLPKIRAVFQTSLKKIAPKSKLMGHMAEILTLMLVSPGGVVTTELQTIDRPVRDVGEDVGGVGDLPDLHTASGSWRSRAFLIVLFFSRKLYSEPN